ncbi:MAG: zinc ribbon domain-containing protein [Acidobacteriota bacterium]|nr:zinc ribbon domain-containing protein [Acidobacteriota bacterium]
MPLYEYKCQTCACRYERIERASSQHDGVCPECGGVASRLLGAPALQFKGSGWYVNDYAKSNGSKPTESEKESATAAASTTDAKSETKSDTKPAKDTTKQATPKVA